MPKHRPVIGLCSGETDAKGKRAAGVVLSRTYLDAVETAGGIPLLLPPTNTPEHAQAMLPHIDGLLIPGGADIAPARYGQRKHASYKSLHPRREAFAFAILAAAEADERDIPILGICLGAQIMNVHRGGTLVQDVPTQWPDAIEHRRGMDGERTLHPVGILPDTLLASIVGVGTLETNSSHHQAIGKVGRGLVVSARARDGVIEGAEDPNRGFFLALQWHPETIARRSKQLALFQALVRAAASVSETMVTPSGHGAIVV